MSPLSNLPSLAFLHILHPAINFVGTKNPPLDLILTISNLVGFEENGVVLLLLLLLSTFDLFRMMFEGYYNSKKTDGFFEDYCGESVPLFHLVGDLVALINELGQDKVFVVGHDWGAVMSCHLCLLRPDKVRALVNLSVVYQGRNPKCSPVTALNAGCGDDYFIYRFQVPGEFEMEIAETGVLFPLKQTKIEDFLGIQKFGEGTSDVSGEETFGFTE